MRFNGDQIELCRRQFPALQRTVGQRPAVFFDGPAGTQVPQRVIDAVANYLAHTNANHQGAFATAQESDQLLAEAHQAVADLLGAHDPACVCFGQNMTSLTFAFSRAVARTWQKGDEIVVTRAEHDANFTPWVLAARDAGVTVRYADIRPDDCTLDLDDLSGKIGDRTRLVAVGCASNASGTINPVDTAADWAHRVGALVFVDAVHYAPHALVDVNRLNCDVLVCSAYKFFGPHVGVMWARRELLEELPAYKVRPAPDSLPGKWMTGTQNHEGIAGTREAIDYLADLGRSLADDQDLDRRTALAEAFADIREYEIELARRLLAGLAELPEFKVWGITDPARLAERLPTVSITHDRVTATQLAARLGARGIFVWHGNYYALPLTERLGLEPEGMVRVGPVHYNTFDEIDRLLNELKSVD
jgi:cysteine desulfurase family protein (TIGR01976 family)